MERLVDLLCKSTKQKGWNMCDAKVCAWILKNKTGISMQMEHEMRLRQPQVSVSTIKLINQGIMTVTTEPKTGGKGRPLKRYHLNESGLSAFFERLNRDIEETIGTISKLKKMLS